MKKTFKGYRVVMALLIALLVMSSVPMFAFAASEGDPAEYVDGQPALSGVEEGDTLVEMKGYLKEPTEKEAGIEIWTCTKHPGYVHLIDVPAKEHVHVWKTTITLASCEEGGEIIEACSCGQTRTRTIAPTGHQFNDADFAKEDKVDASGKVLVKEFYVDLSGKVDFTAEDKVLDATLKDLNENYGLVVDKQPNCTDEGLAHFECTICGKSSKEYSIKAVPEDHEWVENRVIKAATCKEDGLQGRWCSVCSKYENPTIIPKLEAKWDIKSVDAVKDCYSPTFTVYCVNCDGKTHKDVKGVTADQLKATYNITKPVGTAHEFKNRLQDIDYAKSSKNIDQAKTVKEKKIVLKNCAVETEVYYKCAHWDAKHGKVETDWNKVVIPAGKHTWGEWKTIHAPTDTDAGYFARTCKVCNTLQNADGALKAKLDAEENPVEEPGTEEPGTEEPGTEEPADPKEAKYAIDMTNVTVDGNASGSAEVTVTEGEYDVTKLYGRITFVFELGDGQSHAVAVRAYVDTVEGKNVIKIGGVKTPSGAKLTEVQVALVTDADAYMKAEYADSFLAGATK